MEFNREKIRQDLIFNPDMNLHQAFMDLAYDAWQDEDWTYEEMVSNVRFTYGEVVEMAVMLGNYNCQVENGGHMQYFDNGYASKDPYEDKDCHVAQRLIQLLDKHKLAEIERGGQVRQLISEFITRTSCCDDPGDPDLIDHDDLDTEYYRIKDGWMQNIERYLKLWMEYNENPIPERF